MGRSRSRSPAVRRDRERDRRRSRSRSRDRKREIRDRDRHRRSRSRSPARRRSPSSSHSSSKKSHEEKNVDTSGPSNPKLLTKPELDSEEMAAMSPVDLQMMQVMGFSGFDTTKGKHVDGNDLYHANILRKRRYRQYMNRRGGFNRPLDFIA